MFKLDLIDLPSLVRIDGEIRHYETPTGEKYPSVTTVLDKTSDKSFLYAWRARVGEAQAAEITKRAATRGTATHLLCEKVILNQEFDLRDERPIDVHLFKQLEPWLRNNVDNIRVSEGSLFSHKLKVAGSVDLIADYQNKPAVIDFKTSLKNKRKDWIENYFMQCAMYSYMFWEMTGIHHPTLVVAIAVEEENVPQIFVEHVNDWIDKAQDRCKKYHMAK
jgi:ATP-dependent exoDNAse (exonuclease V) beta subunit